MLVFKQIANFQTRDLLLASFPSPTWIRACDRLLMHSLLHPIAFPQEKSASETRLYQTPEIFSICASNHVFFRPQGRPIALLESKHIWGLGFRGLGFGVSF